MDTLRERERPKLRAIFLLKCPYCLSAPLLRKRSWIRFEGGCNNCHYEYRKESGYFWGPFWMINMPIMIVVGLSSHILLRQELADISSMALHGGAFLIAVTLGFIITPFTKSFWLYLDHMFNPLVDRENNNALKL